MSDPYGVPAALLNVLRSVPLWLFVGLTVAGFVVLYAPTFGGVDGKAIRHEYGTLAWLSVVVFGSLSVTLGADHIIRCLRDVNRSRSYRRRLRFVPRLPNCFWHLADCPDGKQATQIRLMGQATNLSGRTLIIADVRILKPRSNVTQHNESFRIAGLSPRSQSLPPRGSAEAAINIMVGRKLAEAGDVLRVKVSLIDQNGESYVLRLSLPHVYGLTPSTRGSPAAR